MVKRNGLYYYFVTTHTGCGGAEFVWRSPRLSGDPADWTPLGALTMNQPSFAGAQHSTAPIQLADGTWWALFHSYECTGGWHGLARQGLLGQIVWTDDGIPSVGGDWTAPAPAPALRSGGIQLLAPFTDGCRRDARRLPPGDGRHRRDRAHRIAAVLAARSPRRPLTCRRSGPARPAARRA